MGEKSASSLFPRFTQIIPSRIHRLNQSNLFLSSPSLDFLLAFKCRTHVICRLEKNQPVNVVRLCKSINEFLLVLVEAAFQIVGHANIKPSRFTGKQVNKIGFFQSRFLALLEMTLVRIAVLQQINICHFEPKVRNLLLAFAALKITPYFAATQPVTLASAAGNAAASVPPAIAMSGLPPPLPPTCCAT